MAPSHVVSYFAIASVFACADRHPEPAEPLRPLGSHRHATATNTDEPSRAPRIPEAAGTFADAVADLDEQGHPDHDGIVNALTALADALAFVAPGHAERLQALRDTAQLLDESPPSSQHHADLVARALDHAVYVFVRGVPRERSRIEQYLVAVRKLDAEVAAIDVDTPLLDQHAQVVVALEAAADALEVAFEASPTTARR